MFRHFTAGWSQQQKLIADDLTQNNGVLKAIKQVRPTSFSPELLPQSHHNCFPQFGYDLAISDGRMAVSTTNEKDGKKKSAEKSVYIFSESLVAPLTFRWSLQQKLFSDRL